MLFTLESAWKSLRRGWKMNLLVVLTLFVAYLFFFLVCCYIEDGLIGLSSFRLLGMENSLLFSGQVPFGAGGVSREDVARLLENSGVESGTIIEYDTYEDPVAGSGYSFYLVDEGFQRHIRAPVIAGRYFTPQELREGAPVCVTNKQSHIAGGPGPGDKITVGGVELTIIGVMNYVPNAGVKLVPYRALSGKNLPNFQVQRYQAVLRYREEPPDMDWDTLGLADCRVLTGQAYYQDGCQRLLGRGAAVLTAGLFILAYALLNLINILMNKLDQQQKSLGIRVALGASNRQIFGQFFLECLALVLGAVALVFASEPVVGPVAVHYFNHSFGPLSAAAMLMASVVSALLISWKLFGRFRRLGIAEIIKKL